AEVLERRSFLVGPPRRGEAESGEENASSEQRGDAGEPFHGKPPGTRERACSHRFAAAVPRWRLEIELEPDRVGALRRFDPEVDDPIPAHVELHPFDHVTAVAERLAHIRL